MKYIYIIRCIDTDYRKIGIANNPHERLSELQTGCPFELKIERLYTYKQARKLEQLLHSALAIHNVRGEWFNISIEDVDSIMDRARKMFPELLLDKSFEL
jgi:hypothetical protein